MRTLCVRNACTAISTFYTSLRGGDFLVCTLLYSLYRSNGVRYKRQRRGQVAGARKTIGVLGFVLVAMECCECDVRSG